MKILILVLLFVSLPFVTVARDEAAHNDCLLQNLKGAKTDRATSQVRTACYQLYKKFMPNKKRQPYYECLLEYLDGVESDEAVKTIVSTCEEKYN